MTDKTPEPDATERPEPEEDKQPEVLETLRSDVEEMKTNLKEEDLLQRVRDIDVMDGVEDGRITPQIAKCSQCERVMSPRHKKCIYCGTKRLVLGAFDTI